MSTPTIEAAHAMGTKGGPVVEAERLAFEAWMAGHCWALGAMWDGKHYIGEAEKFGDLSPRAMMTRQLWAAWRDRAALSQQPAQVQGEPVKVVPYNPTTEMMFSMKGLDPALSLNHCRELWSVAWKAAPTNHPAPSVPADVVLDYYDAGILNDFGGGNVEWWQDYIRAELGRAHDFYQSQIATLQPAKATQAEVTDGIRPEDFTVDAVVKPMGGFAPVNTQGVRVTHKPTGISVTCDAARSQHTNRHQAFEKLRTILAQQPATPEPVKAAPYNTTEEMRWAMKRIDPALSSEQCRALWSAAWSVAPSTHPAPSVPDEKPLPDLMMASYHEAIGWNACRAAMLAAK